MFVALNCAVDMPAHSKPPWIWNAQALARSDGGLRKVVSYRNALKEARGSNAMPILIGPSVEDSGDVLLEKYGWLAKARMHSCYASWLYSNCSISSAQEIACCACCCKPGETLFIKYIIR